MEYSKVKLGDICKTNQLSYSQKDNWEIINYLDTGNITQNVIDEIQELKVGVDKIPSRAKRKVQINDIIYSTVRPNQLHYGIIKALPENLLVSTGFTVISVDNKKADADYVYYYLTQSHITESLQAIGEQSTSAYPSIKPSDLENIDIDLPSLEIQKKVSYILRTIEEKMVLNSKLNANLEEQAKVLYKNWFIDFEPFKDFIVGKYPEGWTESTLEEVTNMSAGGDKPKIVSQVPENDCTIPIYSNGVDKEGLYGYTNRAKILQEAVTVSARGTIGFVCLRQDPYVPIVRLISLEPKQDVISAKYLYLFLNSINITGTGTTQQQLTVPDFKKTKILIPEYSVNKKFTELVNPLFELIKVKKEENIKLSHIRDTLLPRLMSGEISLLELKLDIC